MRHTSGPWKVVTDGSAYADIDANTHVALARVVYRMEDDYRTPECEANAALIAAAPELIDIVHEVMSIGAPQIRDIYGTEFLEQVRAVLKKVNCSEAESMSSVLTPYEELENYFHQVNLSLKIGDTVITEADLIGEVTYVDDISNCIEVGFGEFSFVYENSSGYHSNPRYNIVCVKKGKA